MSGTKTVGMQRKVHIKKKKKRAALTKSPGPTERGEERSKNGKQPPVKCLDGRTARPVVPGEVGKQKKTSKKQNKIGAGGWAREQQRSHSLVAQQKVWPLQKKRWKRGKGKRTWQGRDRGLDKKELVGSSADKWRGRGNKNDC